MVGGGGGFENMFITKAIFETVISRTKNVIIATFGANTQAATTHQSVNHLRI